jgi:hypothetical protein
MARMLYMPSLYSASVLRSDPCLLGSPLVLVPILPAIMFLSQATTLDPTLFNGFDHQPSLVGRKVPFLSKTMGNAERAYSAGFNLRFRRISKLKAHSSSPRLCPSMGRNMSVICVDRPALREVLRQHFRREDSIQRHVQEGLGIICGLANP